MLQEITGLHKVPPLPPILRQWNRALQRVVPEYLCTCQSETQSTGTENFSSTIRFTFNNPGMGNTSNVSHISLGSIQSWSTYTITISTEAQFRTGTHWFHRVYESQDASNFWQLNHKALHGTHLFEWSLFDQMSAPYSSIRALISTALGLTSNFIFSSRSPLSL